MFRFSKSLIKNLSSCYLKIVKLKIEELESKEKKPFKHIANMLLSLKNYSILLIFKIHFKCVKYNENLCLALELIWHEEII